MRRLGTLFLILYGLLGIVSCSDNDEPEITTETVERTVLLFFPWSSNLSQHFQQNIRDFYKAIENNTLTNERVLVCLASAPNRATLMELKNNKQGSITDTLIRYNEISFTSSENISQMLTDVSSIAPAKSYGLIIGGHGMGWLPVTHSKTKANHTDHLHYNTEGDPITRYFGGLTSDTQIEISTLAQGIKNAGKHMEYILFDGCYMASAEVAFDLKETTDYIIASPTEIMAYGFPYQSCGKHLLGEVNYQGIIDEFHSFYSNYRYPYGTAAVIDCSEIDSLATIVKQINLENTNAVNNSKVQTMDGYTPTIFYDLYDLLYSICDNPALTEKLREQLNNAVPFKCNTPEYYSTLKGAVPINTFSGISTSQLSTHPLSSSFEETNWFRVTH